MMRTAALTLLAAILATQPAQAAGPDGAFSTPAGPACEALLADPPALPGAMTMYGAPGWPRGPDGEFVALESRWPGRRGGRLTLGVHGAFDSLNPFTVKGMSAPAAVSMLTVQSLMRRALDEPFTLYPQIARAARVAPDLSCVVFWLDPRARFSDGRPVTAQDVTFSFALLAVHGRPNHRNALRRITGVSTPDPGRIAIALAGNQDRELPMILAMTPVLPRHATPAGEAFARTGFTPLTGSGPYEVASVRPGESVTFRRVKNWWGDAAPSLRDAFRFDEIRYDYYRDVTALASAFSAGLIDVRIETEPRRWMAARRLPAVRDGRILLEHAPVAAPKGMTGFVFNERRRPFGDARVREALTCAFDFEWVNRAYYHGLYRRADSYFAGSELSAAGRPATEKERALLAPFPGAVREDIMEGRWRPPASDGAGRDRAALARAVGLLAEAGYALKDGRMRDGAGRPLAFEVMVTGRDDERLALALQAGLKRIGVAVRVRVVDSVQYERRRQTFDYDMIIAAWRASPSPGNEQYFRWGSRAADQQASFNFAGVKSPAADAMIAAVTAAATREDHVAAVRALDRVLLSGFHVIPLYYAPHVWLARWRHVGRPDPLPLLGPAPETWWRTDLSAASGVTGADAGGAPGEAGRTRVRQSLQLRRRDGGCSMPHVPAAAGPAIRPREKTSCQPPARASLSTST
ncbi:extracellular solute-binding protein [Camelimonas abortus]|uniref:Extracellular solute-binding protein n=1 Tax=Camelimonas abortus TaxID=1017184 RepID=A0ABV7LD11_9HYPH